MTFLALIFDGGNPDWGTAMTGIATVVLASVGFLTLIIVGSALEDGQKTRHGELVTDLSRRWDETQIVQSQQVFLRYSDRQLRDLFGKAYARGSVQNPPPALTNKEASDLLALQAVPNLIDTIGVLYIDGALSLKVIDLMWGVEIRRLWLDWRRAIRVSRRLANSGAIYRNFQVLAERLEDALG